MNDITQSSSILRAGGSLYRPYQAPHEFILNIVSVLLLFSMTMQIGPHWSTSALILPHKDELPAWDISYELPVVPASLDLDLQKSVDAWKANPKTVYIAKNLNCMKKVPKT